MGATMIPPSVVEQQAKLGVSAEESKAQRLKRQQARFRDRGGAFVPSATNPLLDILLARTVSGESPSKAPPRDVAAKRLSPSKARQTVPTHKTCNDEGQVIARVSKSKARKGKAKAIDPEAEPTTKPSSKRRGATKAKKKSLDPGSVAEQPPPVNTKSTSKGKSKRVVRDGISKPRAKTKSSPTKVVVEVLVSDDDQTLVEVPRKSNPEKNIRHEDGGETDDDVPVVRKLAVSRIGASKASSERVTVDAKAERIADAGCSRKDMLERGKEREKTNIKKRPIPRDEEEAVPAPPAKKARVANSTSMKTKSIIGLELPPHPTEGKKGGNPRATDKRKGKVTAGPAQEVGETVEEDDDERLLQRVSKPKKRTKKGNDDDWPRKVVKFADTVPPHSSSQKLKENQSDKKRTPTARSNTKEVPDELFQKQVTKQSHSKSSKGPPREVLERIKVGAARHLQCLDSEPDELDCLS